MGKPMRRSKTRLWVFGAGAVVFSCLVTWIVAVLVLPGIVRGVILDRARQAGIDLSAITVESVGLHEMVIRDAEFQSADVWAGVPLLRVEYSLGGILRGNFKKAIVSGSSVEVRSSGIVARFTDLKGVLNAVQPDTSGEKELEFEGNMLVEGNHMNLVARVDMVSGRGNAELRCRDLASASLLKFLDDSSGMLLKGNLDVSIAAEIENWRPLNAHFALESSHLHTLYSGVEVVLAVTAEGESSGVFESYALRSDLRVERLEKDLISVAEPFRVRIDINSRTGMTAAFTPLSFRTPLALKMNGLNVAASGIPLMTETLFSADLALCEIPLLRRMSDIHCSGVLWNKADGVNWTVQADANGPIHGPVDEMLISARIRANLKASGVGKNGTGQFHMQATDLRTSMDQWILELPGLRGDARITLGPKPAYKGVFRLVKGMFTDKDRGIRADGISGSLPFTSEGPIAALPLSIDHVDFSGISLSNLLAKVAVSGATAIAEGTAKVLDGNLRMRFKTRAGSGGKGDLFHLDFEIPPTKLEAGYDLGRILPDLSGFKCGGGISLLGEIESTPQSGMSGTAEVILKDINLTAEKMMLKVSGLNGTIRFDRLLDFHTLPAQSLRFKSLSLGPADMLDGRIQAQLDGLTTGCIERLEFVFSGGRVTTTAFRFPPQGEGMEIDLFCDGLQMADLLNMISGKNNASGEGTISGVIPVLIGPDGIRFKATHLATSPGETGILRVVDAAEMTGGILLAEESIRDFAYEWAKVNIVDSGNRLNMVVQLKGKPRQKLPLKFDPGTRDFVRNPSGERLVDLKGLLLELKFVDIDVNALLKESARHSRN